MGLDGDANSSSNKDKAGIKGEVVAAYRSAVLNNEPASMMINRGAKAGNIYTRNSWIHNNWNSMDIFWESH